ncbi:MAG TPA: hypothetical protein PK530_06020 [Anaerolineales bacterium]|nr:hypothetical protein [Anaerolineales bacterium]
MLMEAPLAPSLMKRPIHSWLKTIKVAYAPAETTPLVTRFTAGLMEHFSLLGHEVHPTPTDDTSMILTTAPFGEALNWRDALLFVARKKFHLTSSPTIFTIVPVTETELNKTLAYFEEVLQKDPPDPEDYEFPGLSPNAYHTLFEQGTRGGPLMALARLLQSQTKCIRIILLVGEDEPEYAYLFDLVGAHPRIEAADPNFFYTDLILRIVTTLSTREITRHRIVEPSIPYNIWNELSTPRAMQAAAVELGKRKFFTEMVRIADLVHVPMVANTVSSQYSEGCFTTWDPEIDALVTTITGSARPVEKDHITENDLAVIVGVREDGEGALVRHVHGKVNDPPSSEAVEMMEMDLQLPRITLSSAWAHPAQVPVIRSKLHGHRGVAAYDPTRVEFVPLDPPYYTYPVSCATEAQAQGIVAAFARSETFRNPDDPRTVAFTVLPGHGIVIAEKWVAGTQPFQTMYEMMDAGSLRVDNRIPQGPLQYIAGKNGLLEVQDI